MILRMENKNQPKLSVILPCLNEEQSIEKCINDIRNELESKIDYEIIVINNNSTDNSQKILDNFKKNFSNLKVYFEPKIGYGSSCNKGLKTASGKYLILMDIDQTYPPEKILDFVNGLDKGSDFVIGNRFTGEIKKGAMPALHQFIGNPVLSFLLRMFFKTNVRDSHCGMRAIRKKSYDKLHFKTSGMEFASEMVVKVIQANLKISEVAISYHPRIGESKLKSFRDGWRHLRFMLLYSPLYLFLAPGFVLFLIGLISMSVIYFTKVNLAGIQLIIHPIFVSSLLIITGYQLMIFAAFAKSYAITHLGENSYFLNKVFKYLSIDKVVVLGIISLLTGFTIYLLILHRWISSDFGSLDEIKNAIIGLTLMVVGVQTISSAFMMSIVSIKEFNE